MRPIWACVVVAGVLAVASAGCSGGGGKLASTVAPAQRTVTAAPTEGYAPTGRGELDHLIDAALRGDTIEMAALTGYQTVACTKSGASYQGAPPACRENEQEGAQVDVLPSTSCNFTWVRPEDVPDLYKSVLGTAPELNSVYAVNPGLFSFGAGNVIVLQTGTRSDGSPSGVALYMNGGRIVRVQRDCRSFAELSDPNQVRSFLATPTH